MRIDYSINGFATSVPRKSSNCPKAFSDHGQRAAAITCKTVTEVEVVLQKGRIGARQVGGWADVES